MTVEASMLVYASNIVIVFGFIFQHIVHVCAYQTICAVTMCSGLAS